MKKTVTTLIQINTNAQLLNTYELVAINTLNASIQNDWSDFDNVVEKEVLIDENIGKNLTLINLNAAIIEGTLRTLLSEIIHRDSIKLGELSNIRQKNNDYPTITRSYGMIKRFRDDVELKGGWDNIKRQYKEYVDINLDELDGGNLKTALDSLFVIRNAAAHGTAFTMPKERMDEQQKDIYPYKWQNKLHGMNSYVKTIFDMEFFDSLRSYRLAKHFMEITKQFFLLLSDESIFPNESRFHFTNIQSFKFGRNTSASRQFRKDNSEPTVAPEN